MDRQFKVIIIVELAVVLIAVVFSIVYFQMGWYRTNHLFDIVLIALWVLATAFLLFVFLSRSQVQRAMMRRFYLSDEWMYNHKIGYAPLSQIVPNRNAYDFVTFAADTLAHMSYGFEVAETPEDFSPLLLISSGQFKYHLVGESDDELDCSVVIDAWKGNLRKVIVKPDGSHEYKKVGSFANAKELASLLMQNDAIDLS